MLNSPQEAYKGFITTVNYQTGELVVREAGTGAVLGKAYTILEARVMIDAASEKKVPNKVSVEPASEALERLCGENVTLRTEAVTRQATVVRLQTENEQLNDALREKDQALKKIQGLAQQINEVLAF